MLSASVEWQLQEIYKSLQGKLLQGRDKMLSQGMYISADVLYVAIAAVVILILARGGLLKRIRFKDVEADFVTKEENRPSD